MSHRFTELARERFDLALGATVHSVAATAKGVVVDLTCDDGHRTIEGQTLLVAAGRIPNSDQLRVEAGGIATDERGNVRVDQYGRTSSPGVWALGDINGRHQLKHMANGEAKVVRHNLSNPHDLRTYDERPAPHAVFGHPQIGAVGLTEREAQERRDSTGSQYCVITHPYGDAAYGWAMEDTTGFCKLIGDPTTRRVIGAHVIGYQASMLAQQLVQGIHLGNTADEMALGQIWIHPALAEVVEVALIKLVEAGGMLDRAQSGLELLGKDRRQALPRIRIYVDSPLAVKVILVNVATTRWFVVVPSVIVKSTAGTGFPFRA